MNGGSLMSSFSSVIDRSMNRVATVVALSAGIARQRQETGACEDESDAADGQRDRVGAVGIANGADPQRTEPRGEDERAVLPAVDPAEILDREIAGHEDPHEVEFGAQCYAERYRGDRGVVR